MTIRIDRRSLLLTGTLGLGAYAIPGFAQTAAADGFTHNVASGEPSANVAARVAAARDRQRQRYADRGETGVLTNAAAGSSLIEAVVNPDKESQSLLLQAAERFNLSARAYHRVLKVARTLADLGGADRVERPHIAEALSYRINFSLG